MYAVVNSLVASGRGKQVIFRVDGESGPVQVDGVEITQPLDPQWGLVGS